MKILGELGRGKINYFLFLLFMNEHTSFFGRWLWLMLFIIAPVRHLSADWNNIIINYSKNLYGRGAQTWKIASYDKYWVNFANKNGMLQYDGNTWELYPLNNQLDVRSVFPSTTDQRIYVGGIHEFGYFEP